jgi:hypothetical protein
MEKKNYFHQMLLDESKHLQVSNQNEEFVFSLLLDFRSGGMQGLWQVGRHIDTIEQPDRTVGLIKTIVNTRLSSLPAASVQDAHD